MGEGQSPSEESRELGIAFEPEGDKIAAGRSNAGRMAGKPIGRRVASSAQ
jgi:hypothetical protein